MACKSQVHDGMYINNNFHILFFKETKKICKYYFASHIVPVCQLRRYHEEIQPKSYPWFYHNPGT